MLLGVICAALIVGAGIVGLYPLGIHRAPLGLGLAPGVGIALLAVVSTWALRVGLPEQAAGLVLMTLCVTGLVLGIREWVVRHGVAWCIDRFQLGLFLAALLIPLVVLGQTVFVQAGVPDFIDDGAFHAETIDALRHGSRLPGFAWYPTGFHAPAAALLSLLPALDSASGAVSWAVGLTLLAPLTIFGLSAALFRDLRVAAAGALLLALTLAYPYEPQLYSLWPMAAGLLLVVGLWTTMLEYLTEPRPRQAVLGGLLVGGLLLTHGTELYTAAIGVAVLAASRWRYVTLRSKAAHGGLALAVALLLAAPYLPALGGWVASGGATSAGTTFFAYRHSLTLDPRSEALFWAGAVSSGLFVDAPARCAPLAVGTWAAFSKRTGRLLVLLGIIIAGLVAMFRYVDAEMVRAIYAPMLPWAVDDRLLMTLPLVAAPLGGLGLVKVVAALASPVRWRVNWLNHSQRRGVAQVALLLGLTSGLASVFLVSEKLNRQTDGLVGYSRDDAAALAWLGRHAQPGETMMNDGSADAGIWAPYKANVAIVLPHTRAVSADSPELLLRANIGHLDTRADAREAACKLDVHYVYRAAAPSHSEIRQFPGLDVLRGSPALEEIFSSGEAAIFRTRLNC